MKPSPNYSNYNVLIADDIVTMNRTIATMVQQLGFKRVFKAMNGIEALTIIKANQIDLIISDWNMPKMSGLELLSEIRSSEQYHTIPFIMVTGNVSQKEVFKAVKQGVSDYLIKPFTLKMLEDRINRALRKRGQLIKPPALSQEEQTAELTNQENDSQETSNFKKPSSILIVDDEPNNLTVLSGLLRSDYQVQVCRSGQKAIEICLKDNQPDLILLDIMMPEMDGLAVCKALKADLKTEHIPIIFVSALTQTKDVVKGLSLGAVDYIIKPITPEIVQARVKTHMRLVQQRNDMRVQVDTLIENIQLKEELERILQHDVRNPLTAIHSTLSELNKKAPNCEKELAVIHSSAHVIQQMIDNQMVVQKLESGQYKLSATTLDIGSLINEIVYSLEAKSKIKEVDIRFNSTTQIYCLGEYWLCYNLLFNIINNAVEAAPVKSNVRVLVTQSEKIVTIDIHNLGEIPEEIRDSFFDKFVTHGKQKGTGLGTYSAYLAANAQGGDIHFNSTAEKGTTLTIKLPKPLDSDPKIEAEKKPA